MLDRLIVNVSVKNDECDIYAYGGVVKDTNGGKTANKLTGNALVEVNGAVFNGGLVYSDSTKESKVVRIYSGLYKGKLCKLRITATDNAPSVLAEFFFPADPALAFAVLIGADEFNASGERVWIFSGLKVAMGDPSVSLTPPVS